MPKGVTALQLSLATRPGRLHLRWFYEGLRHAILEGRPRRGARPPASRAFACPYGGSRATVINQQPFGRPGCDEGKGIHEVTASVLPLTTTGTFGRVVPTIIAGLHALTALDGRSHQMRLEASGRMAPGRKRYRHAGLAR